MENAPPLADVTWSRPRDLEFIVGPNACTACRGRVTKCTGERPQCQECQRRHSACDYSTTSKSDRTKRQLESLHEGQAKSATDYEQLFGLLRSQPVQIASDILNRIRQGFDVGDILRFLQNGNLRLQLSLVPATSYQFASPYLADMMPILHDPKNDYLNSTLYQSLLAPPAPVQQKAKAIIPAGEAVYRIPYTGARMYDARLASQSLRPSKWTSITKDDNLLCSLLEIYFLYEFPLWSCFHKDIFLDDMASGRGDFCTALLVNAVLAAACHGLDASKERAEFWNPRTWSYMFLAETKRLWELEQTRSTPHLATVQGATILGRIYFVNGMDRLGSKIWDQTLDMAERLDLFSSLEALSERDRVSRTITAWAIFSQQSFSCFYLMKPPAVQHPPKSPLPDRQDAVSYFGEIWLKYPLSEDLIPLHVGQTFLELAKLRRVMNDIAYDVFSNENAHTRLFLKQAEKHHKTLTKWYRSLPEALQPKNAVLPPHLFLHMQYHNLITLAFSSFTEAASDSPPASMSESLEDEEYEGFNPREFVATSKACLATLLHLFYHRHGFDAYYMFLLQVLVQLSFDALDQLRAPNAQRKLSPAAWKATRATLIVCAKGMHDQGRNFYLAECVFRILRSKMDPKDVDLFMGWAQMKQEEERTRLRLDYVHGDYPVISGAITQDPDNQRLEPLLESISDGTRPHVHGSSSIF